MKTIWFLLGVWMVWVTLTFTWEVDKAWAAFNASQSTVDLHAMYYQMFNTAVSAGFLAICLFFSSDRAVYVQISNQYEEESPDGA